MIYTDDEGDRWLACDHCIGLERLDPKESDAEVAQSYLRDHQLFWGTGLTTNRAVRQAASGLDGWRRRKMLTQLEPELAWVWVDLCPGCASPEGWRAIKILGLMAISVKGKKP